MQIYEYIQHPCTTLHPTGRDEVLHQLIAEAKAATVIGAVRGANSATEAAGA
jgi:hypothetical protein